MKQKAIYSNYWSNRIIVVALCDVELKCVSKNFTFIVICKLLCGNKKLY